ncbi:MAG: glycosyl hydrolase [Candidatus Dormiibacterota bacterium]
MTTIAVALDGGLLVVRGDGGGWKAEARLEGTAPRCLAADPANPERIWCGTVGGGLWRTADGGATWQPAGDGLSTSDVSAVAVAPGEAAVYAGINPSAIWRTEDAGQRWEELAALRALPSAPTWSFPPQPETSHVRWITLDPAAPEGLYVCIEAGALVRSADAGETWTDRVPDGPWDTHTLAAHPDAPGRLYSAAGDGFAAPGHGYNESRDGGDTWTQPDDGIELHYLYGLAVDPGNPDTVVVSAAASPLQAHSPRSADSTVYRRRDSSPWQRVQGLPEGPGTTRALLAANPAEHGVFYAANNRGVFRSADGGACWEPVVAPLPEPYREQSSHAIAVTP